MDIRSYDYVVIGSGLAGLAFALHASKTGRVCVLTKGEATDSNTQWAQGGIAAAVGEADSWELHERDTLIAGAGLCKQDAVRFLVQRAPAAIEWLRQNGTDFDVEDGDLSLGREGGHSRNRIVKHADKTGWEIERAVVSAVGEDAQITVFEKAFVTSLLSDGERCVGAVAEIEGLGEIHFTGRAVMLASGGCGKMYRHTTNPAVATADGIALADRLGATISDMEFMQFHPTTLYHPQHRSFLLTEALRGEGATLRNHLGRRFMYDYDPRLELAPRDIVARAIEAEIKKHETWCVYLDTTHMKKDLLRTEFPTIYERLAQIGLEIEKDWIPVVPAQHYSCGGVVTDLHGRTSVPGLYAAGEVACTGVHGANRLASNSLLEALVFAQSAAEVVSEEPKSGSSFESPNAPKAIAEADAIRIRRALQRTMTDHVGIVRSFAGLKEAQASLSRLGEEYEKAHPAANAPYPLETANLLRAARHVIDGALKRTENVGLHYNVDLPTVQVAETGFQPE